MATVVGISISQKKGVPKVNIPQGEFIINHGIKGDAHAGNWHRQVSFLGMESIDAMTQMGIEGLRSGNFAENITTEGIRLYELPIGTQFRIHDVLFEVTQIGKECHQHCEIFHQVGDCIMPREGIFAKVLKGGTAQPGDALIVLDQPYQP
jgi:MOSC domain-containing protein YiiM